MDEDKCKVIALSLGSATVHSCFDFTIYRYEEMAANISGW